MPQSAEDGRVPTPKTPDGGGVIPGYRDRTETPEYTEDQDEDDAGTGGAESGTGGKTAAAKETSVPAEEPGKPVYQPDHTEVREALVKEDLKPSDGWSFGSSAEENTDLPKERETAETTDRNDE